MKHAAAARAAGALQKADSNHYLQKRHTSRKLIELEF